MLKLKKKLPDGDTLYWRSNDFTVFFSMMVLFFGMGVITIFYFNTDWWIMPMGLGYVFLFLFVICKKVDKDE